MLLHLFVIEEESSKWMRECVRVCMHVYDYHIAVVTKPLVLFESEYVRVRVCACVRA